MSEKIWELLILKSKVHTFGESESSLTDDLSILISSQEHGNTSLKK